jgi:tetratricopeptide (TPR) repeat protein
LLAFAVSFFARMGRWDEAERQLRILEKCKAKSAFHEAAVSFYLISGQPATALEHAEAWVAELPRSMEARYALLDLISTLHGQTAATERAVEWMRQHGVHEDFEQAFCQYAQNWQKIRVMKMRVKRIREDGWAWRELVFSALGVFERSDEIRRKRIQPRIEEYLAEVDRVAAGDAATIRAHGLWKEAQSDWRGAVESYLNAIRCEPEHIWAYRRAWECSARLSEAEQRSLWAVIEPIYLEISSHLPNSLEMMRLLAARFGARDAERIVAEWRRLRPDDPNVLEAVVDLLLEHGHGRSDALRALELLRAAVGKFPYHAGLRFSLARACRAVGDYCGAREVFEELVRRRPENTAALMQLAWIQHREGETALALETLDRSRLQAPQESAPFETRAQILMDANRHEEAQAVLQDALQLLPNSVHMRERAITLLTQCGRREEAVEAARQGTRIYPQGAYLWLLLGKILKELPQFAAPGEIEFSLRHSLKWNHGLHEAADWLAIVLVEQLNFKHATDLLAEMEAKLPDPSPVFGRLAWIKRQSGEKSAAVTDLAAVVRKAPWYGWGWNLLLAWLEEDKNWMLCAELLKTVPPQMLTDLAFRQRRLLLLEKAKVAESSTASEWDQLLADFPEDIDVHLRRYDSLREAERVADAAAVLRRIQPIAPDNVYLLARLVRVECDERKYAEALNHALAVSFAAIELNPWPVNQVWDQMRKAGMAAELSAQFFVRLQTGVRPARRALARYADQILDQKGGSRAPKWLRHSFLNHATRQITKLVRLVEKSDWMEGAYLADLLSALNKHGYFKLALSCWNRVKDKGLESSSEAWAQAGRTLVNLGKKREARQLLEGWRTRTGIGMWVLVNYLLCLSRLRQDDLKEIIATCRDALTKLPHDHCARFLAYMEAEACILSGDNEGLIAVWDKYTRYFEGLPQKGEHFPPSQKYLIDELPVAVRLYRQQDARGYAWMHWKLRLRRFWSQQIRAKSRKYFTFILRVAIFLWLFGAVIASFFK